MSSGTPVLPGGSNTYVRTFDATNNLRIEFSRNPKDFALNKYIQLVNVTKDQGYYLRINSEQAARILNANLQDHVWPDGAPRPQTNDGTEKFYFRSYLTQRRDYDFTIGRKSSEQADWDIVGSHERMQAQLAMTARTASVHAVLANAANWESAHVKDVSTITKVTGPWDADTSERGDLQKSLDFASEIIAKATLGVVKKKDLILVMNPTTAHEIAETQALRDHIKQSTYALPQMRQDSSQWDQYGLPDKLYGFSTVVEDAVKVTSRRGAATATRDWVMPDGIAYLLARPGGLVAPAGGPSFSTASLFVYEDMTVESFDDEKHRRVEGHVVDDFGAEVTASVSGFKFTGVLT